MPDNPSPLELIQLSDGSTLSILPMDLERFVRFKDIIARLVEEAMKDNPPGQVLLLRALGKATADDILDVLEALTGESNRERLKKNFRPALLIRALSIALRQEGMDLKEVLGEARGSPG